MTKYQSRKLPIAPQGSSFWHSQSWFGMVRLKGMGGGSASQNKEKRSPMMASCSENKTCLKRWSWLGRTLFHVYDNTLGTLLWHILQQLWQELTNTSWISKFGEDLSKLLLKHMVFPPYLTMVHSALIFFLKFVHPVPMSFFQPLYHYKLMYTVQMCYRLSCIPPKLICWSPNPPIWLKLEVGALKR